MLLGPPSAPSSRAAELESLLKCRTSLRATGARGSDQTDVWSEIAAKSARMRASSPTGAMSAIYERSKARLDDFVRAMPRRNRQVGAVFSIDGRVSGLDVVDRCQTFAEIAPKLIRSYAIDALESPTAASTSATGNTGIRSFLGQVALASVTRFKALGLGDDLRLDGLALAGAALQVKVVHLVAFPESVYEDHDERMRRAFH